MEFDCQGFVSFPGVMSSPDWPYADVPKQSSQVKETIALKGTSTKGSIFLTGTVDKKEE